MTYIPKHAVWEITYACNMCCKHCGSSCGQKYPDELTTEEALKLCDDIAELGLSIITLSGGEPFVRPDWHLLAKRLTNNGVTTNVISNGWFINEELIDKALKAGIVNIGISLDGLKATHDFIRKEGSYNRIMAAFDVMNKRKIPIAVNTSVNKRNLAELPGLKKILIAHNVRQWQFQIARPMGNFLKHPDLMMNPGGLEQLIDFSYETVKEGQILITPGDDIGYYSAKQAEIIKAAHRNDENVPEWSGCHAGKYVFGVYANGDISGCLSIRDSRFIEGNIRQIPLKELWTRPGAFAWNREMTKEQLTGFCAQCQYGKTCLGGCTGSKLTFCHSLYENTYCTYRIKVERELEKVKTINDVSTLIQEGTRYLNEKAYQLADIYFSRVLSIEPENFHAIDCLGFIHFFLEDYHKSREYNEKALKLNPKNAYAWKGLGLCLSRTGQVKKGIYYITKAIQLSKDDYSDYYFDLAVVLYEHNKTKDALKILEKVRKNSGDFKKKSEELYKFLKNKLNCK
ncbi:MAG: radical SAM protein [Spirochaetales bacterium]|nr:radical SAM protein [Spirochaetales bacterium]